ncbi:MAG: anti-sigma factor [Actinomycetota bacterium]|nr:anti-sigma factor [Actinomycetota bacterium]
MEQNGPHDLAAPYALDALEEESARAFEEHLGMCPQCRDEVASFRETAAALAYAAESPPPPAGLGARIVDAARAERPNVASLRKRWALPAAGLAAAAVAATVVLAIWATSLSRSLNDERSARKRDGRIVSILSDREAQRLPLSGANGWLVVSPTRNAVLVVDGLSPAPHRQTYQAWIVNGKRAESAGVFRGGAGRKFAVLTRPVPANTIFGVTLERADGVDQPTGPMLMRARVGPA